METSVDNDQNSVQPSNAIHPMRSKSNLSAGRISRRQSVKVYGKQSLKLQSRIFKADGDSEQERRYVQYQLKEPIEFLGIKITEVFWSPIYCSHPLARYLEIFSACLSVFTVIIIPYYAAFQNVSNDQVLIAIQAFASSYFAFEVVLNIFHIVPADLIAVFREGKTHPTLFQTRLQILKHWIFKKYRRLIFFSISALPWGIIAKDYDPTQRYILSCLSELRLYFIYRVLDNAVHNIGYNYSLVRLCQYIFTIFFAAHWFACTFYVQAQTALDYSTTWLSVALLTKPAPPVPFTAAQYYILSLYWSFTTSATVGYGDITPQNPREYVFVTVYLVFNVFMMAWLVGNVTTIVTQGHEGTRLYRKEFEKMEQYMEKFQLPKGLRDEMTAHMVLKFDLDREYSDVPNEFPEAIRSKIMRTLFRPLIEASVLGSGSNTLIEMLCKKISTEVLLAGTEAVRRFDPTIAAYLLIHGSAKMLVPAEEDAEDFFAGALHAGDTFGEEALFFRLTHPFTVQCTTLCRLISLSAEAWSDLEEQLPKEVRALQLECYFRMRAKVDRLRELSLDHASTVRMGDSSPSPVFQSRPFASPVSDSDSGSGSGSGVEMGEMLPGAENPLNAHRPTHAAESYPIEKPNHRGSLAGTGGGMGSVFSVKKSSLGGRASMGGGADMLRDSTLTSMALQVVTEADVAPQAVEVFEELLKSIKAVVDSKTQEQQSSFFQATASDDVDKMDVLARAGFDVNLTDVCGYRPLHVAASRGRTDAARLLLRYGADPSRPDRHGCTPLLEALRSREEKCAAVIAAAGGRLGLLQPSYSQASDQKTANASIATATFTAPATLKMAAGGVESRPLQLCAWSELSAAVLEGGSHDYLRLLLKFGCPVNAADYEKRTAAHVCCSLNLLQAALVLLEFKADFTNEAVRDVHGRTPLEEAEARSHSKLAEAIRLFSIGV